MDLKLKAWLLRSWGFFWHQYWYDLFMTYVICQPCDMTYYVTYDTQGMSYVIGRQWHMSIWVSKEASGHQQSSLLLQIPLKPNFKYQNRIFQKIRFSLYDLLKFLCILEIWFPNSKSMRKTLKIYQTLYYSIHNEVLKWRNFFVMYVQTRTP